MNMEKILEKVSAYSHAIHTQQAADFLPLWNSKTECILISPAGYYVGIDSIYQDFLLGGIQKAYSEIKLITENIDVRFVTDTCAVIVFAYHTECLRRETGEPHGIS